jgi:hypothetical protein
MGKWPWRIHLWKNGTHSLRIRSKQNLGLVGNAGEWEDLVASRKFPDHVDASSMESSGRDSSTFFFNQRASAPSSYTGCIGIFGTSCCAET